MLALWLASGVISGAAEAPVAARRFGGSAPVRIPAVHVEEVEHEPLALEIVQKTLAATKKASEAPVVEQPATAEAKPDLGSLFGVPPAPEAVIETATPPEAPVKAVPTAEVLDAVYGQGHEIEFLLLLAA